MHFKKNLTTNFEHKQLKMEFRIILRQVAYSNTSFTARHMWLAHYVVIETLLVSCPYKALTQLYPWEKHANFPGSVVADYLF